MLIGIILLTRISLQQSCNVSLPQQESIDCKNLIYNQTCHSISKSSDFLSREDYSCTEIKIIVSVTETKFSKLQITIINLTPSDNVVDIMDRTNENAYDNVYRKVIDLSKVGNHTIHYPYHQADLVLKSRPLRYQLNRNYDQNAQFTIEWAPIIVNKCPEDCTHCCSKTNFKCYSGYEKCNDVWDCPDGQDEIACHECSSSEVRCPLDFQSETSKCIPIHYVCDGVPDCNCPDNISCSVLSGYEESRCSQCLAGGFFCDESYTCVTERLRCNFKTECPRGEDEKNCPIEDMRKVLTAAIVGSLGCGILFVIALGCTRRLFHVQSAGSCSRARRNLQNLANILQVREAPPTYEAAMGIEQSFGSRQSRSRPWRLTRSGLRRDSRRRRRRVQDDASQEELLINSMVANPGSEENDRFPQPCPILRTDSMDSFDSILIQANTPVEPDPSEVPVTVPEPFNIASPDDHSQTAAEGENDADDNKSISSNIH